MTSQSLHNLLLCGKSVAKAAAVTTMYVEINCSVKPDAVYKTSVRDGLLLLCY